MNADTFRTDSLSARSRQLGQPEIVSGRTPTPSRCADVSHCDYLIVIVPGYSILSLGCLVEPLQFTRTLQTAKPFNLSFYDIGSSACTPASGFGIVGAQDRASLEERLMARPAPDAIFFCCGFDVPADARDILRKIMRQSRRAGVPIFGIGAATWALAETGLLPSRKGVVHWSSLSAFKERNLDADPLVNLFHTDQQVTTCAGELAALDLVIEFVRRTFGKDVANQICDRFLVSRPRGPDAEQPVDHSSQLRYTPLIVRNAVEKMSRTLESPLGIGELADSVGVSQRQLERLFAEHLNASPRRFYCELQLGLAWQLCEQTDLPVMEIAIASGFSSHGALSKKFKSRFGVSPTEMRARG